MGIDEKIRVSEERKKRVGERVKLLQQSHGLSDEEMESILSTSHSNYKKILRGDQLLTSDQAITLHDKLDARLDRILGLEDGLSIIRNEDNSASRPDAYMVHIGELTMLIETMEKQEDFDKYKLDAICKIASLARKK